jgi:sporulation protein YlmC with PRC-barrel domain
MLRSVAELYGWSVETADGAVGHLADVYVDDRRWKVRHLVVESGHGLSPEHEARVVRYYRPSPLTTP